MPSSKYCFLAIAICGVVGFPNISHAVLIDDFSEPVTVFHAIAFPIASSHVISDAGLTSTIGGSRSGSVVMNAPVAGDNFTLSYGTTFGSQLSLGTIGAGSTDLTLVYDSNGSPLNANLTGDAGIRMNFNIFDAAAIGSTFNFILTDDDGDQWEQMITATSVGPQSFDFLFAGFIPVGLSGPLNFGDIDEIRLESVITPNGDIRLIDIESFNNVPEPATLLAWFLGLGALSIWAYRRHRTSDRRS